MYNNGTLKPFPVNFYLYLFYFGFYKTMSQMALPAQEEGNGVLGEIELSYLP